MADLNLIEPASPDIAHALLECAHAAKKNDKPATRELTVGMLSVLVACKRCPEDDPAALDKVTHLLLLRVDAGAARHIKGAPSGPDLDRWIGKQEPALGALVLPWAGERPAFPGAKLVALARNPEDPWAVHLTTKDRYRLSHWGIR